MKCYRKVPRGKSITIKRLLAVAASTAIMGAAIVAPFLNITVHAEALPDVAGAAATTVGQYLYSIFAASGNSLANHEVNTAMMTELSVTMQDLAEEGIITLRGQVYDPNDEEQINEVIQAFGQRTGDVEVNVAQFAQRIQELDSAQTERLEQAAFSLDKLETDPNLSYPDYFVYFSYALAGYLEAGMIEGAKLYEIAMNASDNVIITLDDIHDSVIDFFAKNINIGASINTDISQNIDFSRFTGWKYAPYITSSVDVRYITGYDKNYFIALSYSIGNGQYKGCLGRIQSGGSTPIFIRTNGTGEQNFPVTNNVGYVGTGITITVPWFPLFANQTEANNYVSQVANGQQTYSEENYSPDIINQTTGNQSPSTMENTAPAINANEGLLPIPTADIAPFEQAVADNNAQQLYPDNADEAELLINPYIVPNTAPGPAPEPEYNPIPDQPTIPEKDPISSEQEQTNLGGATVGLEDIFPFCIPFDIAGIFEAFTADRQAPVIRCPVDLDGNYIEIDLSVFDDAAALLRTMELIAFVVGLLMVARRLIGAGG